MKKEETIKEFKKMTVTIGNRYEKNKSNERY